jgi:hypothetical protein
MKSGQGEIFSKVLVYLMKNCNFTLTLRGGMDEILVIILGGLHDRHTVQSVILEPTQYF